MADFRSLSSVSDVSSSFDDGMGPDTDKKINKTKSSAPSDSIASLASEEVTGITRLIGDSPSDVRMAKRMLGLKKTYTNASLPELMAMDFFNRNNVQYWFQQYALGGRLAKGGYVADFVTSYGKGAQVININGDYWHNKASARYHDYAARIALTGSYINGLKIFRYTEVWESDLYKMKDRVLELALAGIELRRN